MAYFTIETIQNSAGVNKIKKTRYRATVRVKKSGKLIFNKKKTFDYKAAASKWAKEQIKILENGETPLSEETQSMNLGELIDRYIHKVNESRNPLGRSARYSLRQVKKYDLANIRLSEIESKHIIDFCNDRMNSPHKPQPQTIASDISFLRAVLFHAKSMFGVDINDKSIIDSYPTLKRLKMISRSNTRERRLNSGEYDQILNSMKEYENRLKTQIPYSALFEMSLLTCLRISEICNLEWENLLPDRKLIRVMNRKHPTHKQGNNMLLPLLGRGRALALIEEQPRTSNLIFPYNPRSVTAGFRRIIRDLGITELRYHDLRREGCSRLIEQGYSLSQVASVSGHKDLKVLHNIYVTIFPESLLELDNLPILSDEAI